MTIPQRKHLRWLISAVEDVEEITAFVSRRAPKAAAKLAARLKERAKILAYFPHIGSICPQYERARFITHGRFVIYYTVHRTEVVIRAVVRGVRQFQPAWLRRRI
jgi:plasmid stabilization system protein ParE